MRATALASLLLPLLAVVGCSTEPAYVSENDLSRAATRGDTTVLCAGLTMPEDATRKAAGEALQTYANPVDCLCERVVRKGRWDAAILAGLSGADDPTRFGCVGKLLEDPAQPDRGALATALAKIPATRAALLKAAREDKDAGVRAAALPALRGTKEPTELELVLGVLKQESDASVRASAASALLSEPTAAEALLAAAKSDAAPEVRAAALEAYVSLERPDTDEVACAALSDSDPTVRARAAGVSRATTAPARLACLRARMLVEEPDTTARAALLQAVAKSPSPEAAKILCDSIPAWGRLYVRDAKPAENLDVARAQNDRDQEQSYACFQKHAFTGGLSCEGQRWIRGWFKDVGGAVAVPRCGAGGAAVPAASNEISFE